ncbi:MAG: CoB--CoM heterodisulfide reductase iron-sulfur subunit B family protein [Nitrososphaerota archaeon]|nr:CoB--CoM heterodisulfide reductase iron-sulfur subunit B family protein [Candidatus Bathyarchaeota archaeon]MDW8022718.1 CoB--CoM heterodisulfide reductase iron-sulfur subunit B family protein [Nitrososphaerota archaeon]
MKVAVFWGCRILTSQYAYEMSTRQVLPRFGIELVDLKEMHCCGNAIESVNKFAAAYMAARAIALANETGIKDLLFPCGRCHFTVSETKRMLALDKVLEEKIARLLNEERLKYSSEIRLWHVVDLLHDVVGVGKIKENVKIPLKGLKLASHIGCQAIRPSYMERVDSPENPKKMDALIEALGAESVEYPEKLDCCGAALMFSHPDAALSLTGAKLNALQKLRLDGLVDSCPAGHAMFDTKQEEAASIIGSKLSLPVLYYTQLLGLALGVEAKDLGLHLNKSSIERILERLNLTSDL